MGFGFGSTLSVSGLVFFGTITSLAAKIGAREVRVAQWHEVAFVAFA